MGLSAKRSKGAAILPTRNGYGVLRLGRLDRAFAETTPLFWLTAVVMVASLVLGGGTRGGFLSDALLQLIAIPLLILSLWKLFEVPLARQTRLAVLFCLAVAALPLLQLIPLPPWLWTRLPNREPSAAAFEIAQQTIPWMPLSVSPRATWVAALSLIPPLAVFLGTLLLSYRDRRRLSLVIIAFGIVAVFIGLIQVAQGPGSTLRFFQITNPTEAVGFFANRNHYAAFIYVLMLFTIPWTMSAAAALGARLTRREYDVAAILGVIGGFTVLVLFLAGEAMARSRAGLGLTIVALFGALVLGFFSQGASSLGSPTKFWSRFKLNQVLSGFTPTKLLLAAVALTVTFSLQYALFRIQERFEADPTQDARLVFVPNTVEAAKAYMPLGSGLGTFTSVYPLFEKPQDALPNTYANHAHNDVVEFWLETGIFGLMLMGLFASWLLLRAWALWRNPPPPGASELDWSLARAATIAIGLVLAHSFVDYPLRTSAMMGIMAFACALLIKPASAAKTEAVHEEAPVRARRREQRRAAAPVPAAMGTPTGKFGGLATPADLPQPADDQQWGADINWPKEWSTSSKAGSPGGKNDEPPDVPGDK